MTSARWNGNREAQRQADEAYAQCRPKRKKKKKPKHRKQKKFGGALPDPITREFLSMKF